LKIESKSIVWLKSHIVTALDDNNHRQVHRCLVLPSRHQDELVELIHSGI